MLTSEWPTRRHPQRAPFVVRQVDFLRRKGISVDVFHVDGRKNPARYFRARRQVSTLFASKSYDVVHAQWAQSALAVWPLRHLPLIVTFHGSDAQGIVSAGGRYAFSGWILRQITRAVAYAADEVILVSARLARGLPERHYHIIPGGIDFDTFRIVPQMEAKHLLRLRPEKRYVLFAAARSRSVKRYGLAKAAVERLAEHYNAELLVAEGVQPNEMPLYMNACDVLLLTSLHEGSPTVVKEALACNLAVVSTDVGDVAERIANIEGCVLCREDKPEVIAAALSRVLERRERIKGRVAVGDLDEGVTADRVISVYRRAIARSSNASSSHTLAGHATQEQYPYERHRYSGSAHTSERER